ncbi:MAG TPA: hypothetical protein DCG24_02805 [Bacteroidetes bacterium]|nr:hypothetical protein [Bacteroidota bacterium]HAE34602.1 hypothetical protein [Bacteroidota bacterium]
MITNPELDSNSHIHQLLLQLCFHLVDGFTTGSMGVIPFPVTGVVLASHVLMVFLVDCCVIDGYI